MSILRHSKRTLLILALAAAALTALPAAADSQAGYDKGFMIKTDTFEVHFGSRIQLQYGRTEPDTFQYDSLLKQDESTDPLNELNVRRFKLYMTGFVFNPSVKFKLQLDVERFKPGGGSAGNVRLEEAYVDLTEKPWTQLRLGQFKVPYGYEKMMSSGRLNLVDRSIVHSFFGVNQEPGVNLYGQSFDKSFRYDVAVTTGVADNTGFDTRNDVDANGKSDFRYTARVTWEPLGEYKFEQGAVSAPDTPQLSLQLGYMLNKTTIPNDGDPFLPKDRVLPFKRDVLGANSPDFSSTLDADLSSWSGVSNSRKSYDRAEIEGVATFKYDRFAVEGQYITGTVDPNLDYLKAKNSALRDLTFDNTGMRLQAGFMIIPTKFEVAGRYATVGREAKLKAGGGSVKEEIDQSEWRIGLNWYFSKHDWKWQVDFGQIGTEWKLDGRKLAVPRAVDFPDKVISNNTRSDKEFRTQFQIQF